MFKKPVSVKSVEGVVAGSHKSATSQATDLSDVEKIERILNEAKHANKAVVKYFGKLLEEFRR